jgi:hypothetical protein
MARDLIKLVQQFDAIEFASNEDLKKYAKLLRDLGAELYLRTHFHASEIEAKLSRYKGKWYHFGVVSRVRARLVSARLRIGAEGVKAWAVSGIKMHAAFEKHFVAPERAARAKAKHAKDPRGFEIKV